MKNYENNRNNQVDIIQQVLFPDEIQEQSVRGLVSESMPLSYSSRLLADDGSFIKLVRATREGLPYKSLSRAQKIMPFSSSVS